MVKTSPIGGKQQKDEESNLNGKYSNSRLPRMTGHPKEKQVTSV